MARLSFSWLVEDKVAGHQAVFWLQDVEWLKKQGVLAMVRLANSPGVTSSQIAGTAVGDCPEFVEDMQAPTQAQIDIIMAFILELLSNNRPVGVSCNAGVGRTGTILACYLVRKGKQADEAIKEVRLKRPGSIETVEQEEAVSEYARRLQSHLF